MNRQLLEKPMESGHDDQASNDMLRNDTELRSHSHHTRYHQDQGVSGLHQRTRAPSSRRFSFQGALRMSTALWNLQFQNKELEAEYRRYVFTYEQQLFRYGLGYLFVTTVIWMIYFVVQLVEPPSNLSELELANAKTGMQVFVAGAATFCVLVLATFLFTFSTCYRLFWMYLTAFYSFLLCSGFVAVTWLVNTYMGRWAVQPNSSWPLQLLVVLYCFCPVYLPILVAITVLWVITWGIVLRESSPVAELSGSDGSLIVGTEVVLLVFLLVVLVHLRHQNERNQRSIFWKTGQSLVAKHGLQIDKRLKQQIILSVVPRNVAFDLLDPVESRSSRSNSLTAFRPLTMSKMDNVSILFADIVGFTKMSARKSAEHVVSLLNDLFGRFDQLAERIGCEKISTLGDCYYCVSGCPEPRHDHANCCVDMGIAMIEAIAEFCADTGEDVNMRVGVHTGTVLCGVIGVKRIKFDVWSSDVTLANKLEAGGHPGCVHVSQATVDCLDQRYYLMTPYSSAHSSLKDMSTFLVAGSSFPVTSSLKRKRSWHDQLNLVSEGSASSTQYQSSSTVPNQHFFRGRRLSIPRVLTAPGASWLIMNNTRNRPEYNRNMTNQVEMRKIDTNDIGTMLQSREHSSIDQQLLMVQQIRDKSESADTLADLPINWFTLRFHDPQLERSYWKMLAGESNEGNPLRSTPLVDSNPGVENTMITDVSPRRPHFMYENMNQMSDTIVSFIGFMGLSIVCFMGLTITVAFVALFISMLVIESVLLAISLATGGVKLFCQWTPKIKRATSSLLFRHGQGLVMVLIPAALIYSTYEEISDDFWAHVRVYSLSLSAAVFCIIFCCNFAQLFWFIRAAVGVALSVAVQVYAYKYVPTVPVYIRLDNNTVVTRSTRDVFFNAGVHIDVVCLLVLVAMVCRMYEVAFRLTAKTGLDAAHERANESLLRDQAERLLQNIFPDHVLCRLRATCEVSLNYERVGVIFASIANFNEFYSEKYEHGKECIRVLNELISDFDDLLDRPRYKYIDKIKTVGSTYMAASGLNRELLQSHHQNPAIHLRGLVNFALELHNLVESFNRNIFGFKFVLRVGFNAGPVTAGVVGTTKQLYDIWGDTVNISSRMESTGVNGKIQMTESCSDALRDYFVFEKRGTVFVKGVGDTETCLVTSRV